MSNQTLLDWAYPSSERMSSDVRQNWVAYSQGCNIATDCYCFHVSGDMSRSMNQGEGRRACAKASTIGRCDSHTKEMCNCLHGNPCLFSDMRPTKILAVIAAARAAGVTHIVEEGRFGGLSASMYALHGFDVTSIEFLPLDGAAAGLAQEAPQVKLLTGDGSVLVPRLLSQLSDAEAARTAVIFDGEKREVAYQTYVKIRSKVAFAVFDDTNILSPGTRIPFNHMLMKLNETCWSTKDDLFHDFVKREAPAIDAQLRPLRQVKNAQDWWGGIHNLQDFHFTIVRGGAWRDRPNGDPAFGGGG